MLSSDILSYVILSYDNPLSITRLFHEISYSKYILSRIITYNEMLKSKHALNFNIIDGRFGIKRMQNDIENVIFKHTRLNKQLVNYVYKRVMNQTWSVVSFA